MLRLSPVGCDVIPSIDRMHPTYGSPPRLGAEWTLDGEGVWRDPALDALPGHGRGDRKSLPGTRGVGADGRGTAAIAQIIEEDAITTLCLRRQEIAVWMARCEGGNQLMRHPMRLVVQHRWIQG